jgi:hypothetical protein
MSMARRLAAATVVTLAAIVIGLNVVGIAQAVGKW